MLSVTHHFSRLHCEMTMRIHTLLKILMSTKRSTANAIYRSGQMGQGSTLLSHFSSLFVDVGSHWVVGTVEGVVKCEQTSVGRLEEW